MSNTNSLLGLINCKKVLASTKELFTLVPEIVVFNYSRIYHCGNQLIFSSNNRFLNNYVYDSKDPKNVDFYKTIGLANSEFIILSEWVKSLNNEEKDYFNKQKLKKQSMFNCDEELCLTIQKELYQEIFHYICNDSLVDPVNFLINSRKILRQFAFKFIHDNKLQIDEEEQKLFSGSITPEPSNRKKLSDRKFPFILPKKFYVNDGKAYLTSAELKCAIEALNGKSNQEIGDTLGISIRTVEVYMDSMRKKIGCERRNGVIQYFLKNTQNTYLHV